VYQCRDNHVINLHIAYTCGMETKEQLRKNDTSGIYLFDKRANVNEDTPYWEAKIKCLGVDFRVSFEFMPFSDSPLQKERKIKIKTYSGRIEQVHVWGVKQIRAAYTNGILEKFLLRTIFSDKVTDCILYYYKY
jgi:hypothetical protein